MNNQAKTKAQLLDELVALRQSLAQLEALESQLQRRIGEVYRMVGSEATEANCQGLQSRLPQPSVLSPVSADSSLAFPISSVHVRGEGTPRAIISLDKNLPQNPQKSQEHSIFAFPKHQQLNPIFEFIEANFHRSISLNKIAKTFNYSAAYLTSLVRRLTGKTLYQWIVQRRMFQARYLLISSNWSVRKIGEAVGYSDPGHFIKQFTQFHHQSPQSWRNSHRYSGF
ncbi:MAG: AraC family transcriptional regulator [Lyngbya sp.]|nr:AraC family transcriptional regulator [Lyngbya sp.]